MSKVNGCTIAERARLIRLASVPVNLSASVLFLCKFLLMG